DAGIHLDEFPVNRRQTLSNLGHLYFAERHWEAACRIYSAAIAAGDTILAAAYTEGGRQAEVGETAQLYTHTAYCLLHLGQPAEGLLQQEHGQSRSRATALA